MSNFDKLQLLKDGQTDRRSDRRMEERAPMSQSQEVREIFHATFDGCLVLQLIRILTLT